MSQENETVNQNQIVIHQFGFIRYEDKAPKIDMTPFIDMETAQQAEKEGFGKGFKFGLELCLEVLERMVLRVEGFPLHNDFATITHQFDFKVLKFLKEYKPKAEREKP